MLFCISPRATYSPFLTSLNLHKCNCKILIREELEGNRKFETVFKNFLLAGLAVVAGHTAGGRLLRASEPKLLHDID
jgi:hypothetical protein